MAVSIAALVPKNSLAQDLGVPNPPEIRHKTTLRGHDGHVWCAAFSPDSQLLATGGHDYKIKLWDVPQARLLGTLRGHADVVVSVAFSPDGKHLASGGFDNTVCLWDAATGERRHRLTGHNQAVFRVAFSPDSRLLASASFDHTLRVWDPASGQNLATIKAGVTMFCVAFSPDGQTLAAGCGDGTLRMWSVRSAEQTAAVGSAQVQLRGNASNSTSSTASGAQLPHIQLRQTLQAHVGRVFSLAFSPDGKRIASAGQDRAIRLWDAARGTAVENFSGHTDAVYSLAFSPDSQLLASGSLDRTVKIWDVPSRRMQVTLHAGEARARGVRARPEIENPQLVAGGHVGRVRGVAFSGDGRLLATVSEDGTVRLWDVVADKSI